MPKNIKIIDTAETNIGGASGDKVFLIKNQNQELKYDKKNYFYTFPLSCYYGNCYCFQK